MHYGENRKKEKYFFIFFYPSTVTAEHVSITLKTTALKWHIFSVNSPAQKNRAVSEHPHEPHLRVIIVTPGSQFNTLISLLWNWEIENKIELISVGHFFTHNIMIKMSAAQHQVATANRDLTSQGMQILWDYTGPHSVTRHPSLTGTVPFLTCMPRVLINKHVSEH